MISFIVNAPNSMVNISWIDQTLHGENFRPKFSFKLRIYWATRFYEVNSHFIFFLSLLFLLFFLLSLSLSPTLYISQFISQYIYLSFSVSLPISFSPSFFLIISLSIFSRPLSLSLSPSLSLALFLKLIDFLAVSFGDDQRWYLSTMFRIGWLPEYAWYPYHHFLWVSTVKNI